MNKKQLEKWQEIYSVAMMIGEYRPWELISEETAFVYITKDEKQFYLFKIWGNTFGTCGISCYPSFKDYMSAHNRMLSGNPKDEPAFYMQNAIYGFWDSEENVSGENKKLLKKLGFICEEDGSWLNFEICEERHLPRMLTDVEAENFADALGNFYMMLKAVFENKLPVDFKNGDAVMRKYAGNGTWHNGVVPWEFVEKELSACVKIRNTANIKKIKNIPARSFSVELDMRCLKTPFRDDETGTVFFPFLIIAADAKTGYIYTSEFVEYNKSIEEGLFENISEICFAFGKPRSIITNDFEVVTRIEDFCDKTDIKLKYQRKKLPHIEAALADMFDYFGFESEFDCDHSDSKSFYISVSLMTGCYRHIKISGDNTLEQLHEAILDAFDFIDDHAHAFFLNNKVWSGNGYYSKYIDERKHSCDFVLSRVLTDKQQFVYVFDFGNEWNFKCKVLKIKDEPCTETEIVRSVGESPEQYFDYNEI